MYKCGECKKRVHSGKYKNNNKDKPIFICDEKRSKFYKKEVAADQVRCPYFSHINCFITTIVVNLLELDNNTLNTLRTLRDKLELTEEGNRLLVKYDYLGPIIANILLKINSKQLADKLHTLYIGPCKILIEEGKEKEAINLYKEMFDNLVDYFHIDDFIPNHIYDLPYDKGHGRFMK